MKYIKPYNESLRDQMTPKKLEGDAKLVHDAKQDVESINMRTSDLTSEHGTYKFEITNISKLHITVYYNSDDMKKYYNAEYIKSQPKGWHLFQRDYREGNRGVKSVQDKTWDELFVYIINLCYPNIDSTVDNVNKLIEEWEDNIRMNKELLDGLENAKKILKNDK